MNLLRRIQVYRLALWTAGVCGVIFLVITSVALIVLLRAESWSQHTSEVLASLAETQRAITAAEQMGRTALTNPDVGGITTKLRQQAMQDVENLQSMVVDNPEQAQNAENLETALRARWAAQDEQVAREVIRGGVLVFPVDVTIHAQESAKTVELALSDFRAAEIRLMFDRNAHRSAIQLQLTYWVIFIFLIAFAAIVVAVRDILKELGAQKVVRQALEDQLLHASETGSQVALTERDVVELIRIIDERPRIRMA